MTGQSLTTTDHATIREWVEARGGKPSTVRETSADGPGVLRIDFEGERSDDGLATVSWDDFFDKFDREKLMFLYQETTASGATSRFYKFIDRDQ